MHAMHYTIAVWAQVVRTLKYPGENVKYLFGCLVHRERMVRRITMKEKCLEEKGEVPVRYKKAKNNEHSSGFPVKTGKPAPCDKNFKISF
jgi:hypothetical protein